MKTQEKHLKNNVLESYRATISIGVMIFFILFLTSFVSSETSFYVKNGDSYNLTFVCQNTENEMAVCSGSTSCNITIHYPNSTILIDKGGTTNLNNGKFYYQLNENLTTTNGEYQTWIGCSDNGLNSSTSFIFEVNPTGIRPSDQKTSSISIAIYFTLIIGILFFLGFLFTSSKPPVKWTFFIFAIFFFLITLNILFVGLQDAVVNPRLESFFDSFTAISFYVYWFLAGVLAIMWFLTFLQTYFYNKNLKNIQKYGLG